VGEPGHDAGNTKAATRDDVNYLVSYSGAIAQSPSDAAPTPDAAGDLETGRQFGARRCASRALGREVRDRAMPAALQLLGHEKDLGGGFKVRRLLPAARQRSVGPVRVLRPLRPGDRAAGRQPRRAAASAHRAGHGELPVRGRDDAPRQPGHHAAHRARRHQLDVVRRRHRALGAQARRPAARPFVNHGLQLWVALPEAAEEGEASFVHTPADAIPEVQADGAQVRVLVGDAFGVRSPVVPASPTLYLDVALPRGGTFDLPAVAPELAVYPIAGEFTLDGVAAPAHQMLVLQPGTRRASRPRDRRASWWSAASRSARATCTGTSSPAARTASCRPAPTGKRDASRRAGRNRVHPPAADPVHAA
jgi:hypothetical protein